MSKVYFLTDGELIKIGYTSGHIKNRIQQLSTGNGRKIYELGYVTGGKQLEGELHKLFGTQRVSPNSEWFVPDEELLSFINDNNEKPNVYAGYIDNMLVPLLSIKI